MNIKNKIMGFYLLSVVAIMVYVPFTYNLPKLNTECFIGYDWIFNPDHDGLYLPKKSDTPFNPFEVRATDPRFLKIDFGRIGLELVGITAIAGASYFLTKGKQ